VDNPKLAARHFLNAIDKVSSLKEKYEKELAELNREIPMTAQIASKPFEKEKELAGMKEELSSLEREIAIGIQEKQMKQNQAETDLQPAKSEAPHEERSFIPSIINLDSKPELSGDRKLSLVAIPHMETRVRRTKGLRM
jgi:hypothetical protein